MDILSFLLITFSPIFLTIRKQTGEVNYQLLSFDYTNCLRGVAILLIMAGHLLGTFGGRWFTPFGGIGVALFLFLSGFGCNESYKHKGLSGFWWKKVKRVLLPYAIVITLICIIKQKWNLVYYLLNITGLETGFWFIAYLMKWYIVYWVTTRFLPRYRIIVMILFAIISYAVLPEIEAAQSLSFLLGVICSERLDNVKSFSKSKLAMIAGTGIFISITFLLIKQLPLVRQHEGEMIYALVQMLIKLPCAIGLVAALNFVPALIRSRYLSLAGTVSYELFLVHFPLYTYLDGRLLWAIVLLIGSFMVAYGFNKFNLKISKLLG